MADVIFATAIDAVRLQENDRNMDFDGGRVVLVGASPEADAEVQGTTLVVNYRRDEPMDRWPLTREERAARRFTLLVLEGAGPDDLAAVGQALGVEIAQPAPESPAPPPAPESAPAQEAPAFDRIVLP
jgi:hypothetical protein